MVWVLLALGGAVCTSLTTILAKIGIKNVNSNFATAYRTGIVIICALVMCAITNDITQFGNLTAYNWLFLVLSGLATGISWLFYFGALKEGDVNKVAPIDKSSFVLTTILFLIFFFDDTTKNGDPLTIGMLCLTMLLMLAGTFLMLPKPDKNAVDQPKSKKWLIFAILSAVFASFVSLFVKLGLKGIPSDVGTFYRTAVVLVFAWAIVLVKKDYKDAKSIGAKSWIFLTLSGIATGGAWLLEYEALNFVGANPVAVNCIGKLSILLTMLLSRLIMKEKFTVRSLVGLGLLTAGIGLIIGFSL
ncbi:MAG: EamA family transporter [Christensenellales bacterium]